MQEFIVSIIIPILTALLSYLGARHQSNKELEKLREAQTHEIEKIREEAKHELNKINIEMDKQTEVYEKNAQTDAVSELFSQLINGNADSIDNLFKTNQVMKNKK